MEMKDVLQSSMDCIESLVGLYCKTWRAGVPDDVRGAALEATEQDFGLSELAADE